MINFLEFKFKVLYWVGFVRCIYEINELPSDGFLNRIFSRATLFASNCTSAKIVFHADIFKIHQWSARTFSSSVHLLPSYLFSLKLTAV